MLNIIRVLSLDDAFWKLAFRVNYLISCEILRPVVSEQLSLMDLITIYRIEVIFLVCLFQHN